MKSIKIACQGASRVNIDFLIPLQGNLKVLPEENYQKLKSTILKLGMSEPISVWRDGDKLKILNGHQRALTLRRMRDDEGYEVPTVPINLVDAKDLEEAKSKILSLTSQYGIITEEGLQEFLNDTPLDLEDFNFGEFNLDDFKLESQNASDLDASSLEEEKIESQEGIAKGSADMVRVDPQTHRKIKELAEHYKTSQTKTLRLIVDNHYADIEHSI